MGIPDYQSLMLPVLLLSSKGEQRIGDVVNALADQFRLTSEEKAELLPSGKQTVIANRVHWAKTYLKQAGLVEPTRRGHFKITERGIEAIASNVSKIDVRFLERYPEFNQFRERASVEDTGSNIPALPESALSPEDSILAAYGQINTALGRDILDRTLAAPPSFFEKLIVQLLLAMGYGGSVADAGKALGRSGDDGVDGVIDQDSLGLDRVYIQAKRYRPQNTVGPSAIRDFFGSLDMHKANKGLFVTTSGFSSAAIETADRLGKRIVLIDGNQLAKLMIRYNVGCRIEQQLEIKRIDEEFFE